MKRKSLFVLLLFFGLAVQAQRYDITFADTAYFRLQSNIQPGIDYEGFPPKPTWVLKDLLPDGEYHIHYPADLLRETVVRFLDNRPYTQRHGLFSASQVPVAVYISEIRYYAKGKPASITIADTNGCAWTGWATRPRLEEYYDSATGLLWRTKNWDVEIKHSRNKQLKFEKNEWVTRTWFVDCKRISSIRIEKAKDAYGIETGNETYTEWMWPGDMISETRKITRKKHKETIKIKRLMGNKKWYYEKTVKKYHTIS